MFKYIYIYIYIYKTFKVFLSEFKKQTHMHTIEPSLQTVVLSLQMNSHILLKDRTHK